MTAPHSTKWQHSPTHRNVGHFFDPKTTKIGRRLIPIQGSPTPNPGFRNGNASGNLLGRPGGPGRLRRQTGFPYKRIIDAVNVTCTVDLVVKAERSSTCEQHHTFRIVQVGSIFGHHQRGRQILPRSCTHPSTLTKSLACLAGLRCCERTATPLHNCKVSKGVLQRAGDSFGSDDIKTGSSQRLSLPTTTTSSNRK